MRASATVATIRARLYYTHTKSARKERKKKKGKFKQTVTKTKRDVVRCSRAETTTTTKINAPVFTKAQNSALVQTQTRACECLNSFLFLFFFIVRDVRSV